MNDIKRQDTKNADTWGRVGIFLHRRELEIYNQVIFTCSAQYDKYLLTPNYTIIYYCVKEKNTLFELFYSLNSQAFLNRWKRCYFMIIAIDGPSGSGKSSTAKAVAKALAFTYLDTGAMYRAVALGILLLQIDPLDEIEVAKAVKAMDVSFKGKDVFLNGYDVTDIIRKDATSKAVTPVSANPAVRELLVEKQREIAANNDIVMEGRDIGTVVFPNADYKFFLVANENIRAMRRLKESKEDLSFEEIKADLLRRDKKDSSREHSPLKKADDAIEIDTSDLTFDEQVDKILSYMQTKEPKHGGK